MSSSFKDQLYQAGLITKKQLRKLNQQEKIMEEEADKYNKAESAVESHYVADNNSYANNFVNALMKQTDLFDERTVPSTSNRNTSSCVSSSDNIQKQATSSAANTSSELEDRDKENVWLIDALLLETRVARIEQEHISS